MTEILYDSGALGEKRGQIIIRKTRTGIAVEHKTLYDEPDTTTYYKDHPPIPDDWTAPINDYGTTEADYFLERLRGYKPSKIISGVSPQKRYDEANTQIITLKLNKGTDKDILDKLNAVPSKQGYIKQLIRADIKGQPK